MSIDATTEPCLEPSQIHAGDTVMWTRKFADYPASGGFSLAYTLVTRTATLQVNGSQVTAIEDAFQATIPATITANWTAGMYRWQAYISDVDGNRTTVGEGILEVLPNLQVTTGGIDDRETDEKILDAIVDLLNQKVLAGDAQRYMIHGRELQRYTFAELREFRSEYALRVRNIRRRRGERVPSRTVRTAFLG